MKNYVRDFWRWLSTSMKVVFVLFLIVIVGLVASEVTGFFHTSADQLDTFMIADGLVIWKHRSAPHADYAHATGPDVGFLFLHTGALKTPTAKGAHLWTFELGFVFMAVAFGIPIAISLKRFRKDRLRRWRSSHGCCPSCGYDLRATSGRCPECGTEIPTGAKA